MEFTLTFGAVGDFIAVVALIKDIVSALDDCRGSAQAYRDVLQSLEILQRTVEQAAAIYGDDRLSDGLDDLTALALRNMGQIRRCLEGFCDTIRKFGPSLAEGGSGNVFRDVARKIQWKLEEKDVDKFRAEVMGVTMSLDILLDVTNIRIAQRNHEAATKQAAATGNRTIATICESSQALKQYFGSIGGQILSKLNFVAGLGMDLQQSTSQLLSVMITVSGELSGIRTAIMRLERPLSDEHFVLEDVTGRVFPIHLKTITSWEAFEFIINDRFKGKRGASRIRRKRYSLQERWTQREVIRSMDWESAFMPYQRVDMSLMCIESQKIDQRTSSCPSCKTISPGETGVQVQCQNCNTFFTRVVEVDDEVENDEQECRPSREPEPEPESDDEDVQGFRRITLISRRRGARRDLSEPTIASSIRNLNKKGKPAIKKKTFLTADQQAQQLLAVQHRYDMIRQEMADVKRRLLAKTPAGPSFEDSAAYIAWSSSQY